jgi:hypothetical protein
MKRFFLFIFAGLVLFSFNLRAEDVSTQSVKPLPPSPFSLYLGRVDKKFDKGAINFAAGWTQIVSQPVDHFKNPKGKNRWLQAAGGVGSGLVYGVVDILGGFTNSVTSVTPDWEIPLPEGGLQIKRVTGGDPEAEFAAQAEKQKEASENPLFSLPSSSY